MERLEGKTEIKIAPVLRLLICLLKFFIKKNTHTQNKSHRSMCMAVKRYSMYFIK